jgi:hypothetical protein
MFPTEQRDSYQGTSLEDNSSKDTQDLEAHKVALLP